MVQQALPVVCFSEIVCVVNCVTLSVVLLNSEDCWIFFCFGDNLASTYMLKKGVYIVLEIM
jgi:hypothetical protein